MTIEKVAEGAFFVTSYTEQTIMTYLPGVTGQTVVTNIKVNEIKPPVTDENLPTTETD